MRIARASTQLERVVPRRGYDGRRARTRVSLTPQGTSALRIEVDMLRDIVDFVQASQQ